MILAENVQISQPTAPTGQKERTGLDWDSVKEQASLQFWDRFPGTMNPVPGWRDGMAAQGSTYTQARNVSESTERGR